jgi:hypothetical protein
LPEFSVPFALVGITTMAAALLPLLWAEGAGSEIMCRVAAPMIGGLATSAFLTLEVLPVLYTIWRARQLRKAQRLGVPIATVVGEAPSWARTGDRGSATEERPRPRATVPPGSRLGVDHHDFNNQRTARDWAFRLLRACRH